MNQLQNVAIIDYYYEKSDSRIIQGNKDFIRGMEQEGYYVAKGGYGSYRMNKPSVARVKFLVNSEVKEQSVKGLIRDYYGVSRVTENKLIQFLMDYKTGKFDLKYSDEEGLVIYEQ